MYTASHIAPIPIRFSVNPGITCPDFVKLAGICGKARSQEADDTCGVPSAVPTRTVGAFLSTRCLGAFNCEVNVTGSQIYHRRLLTMLLFDTNRICGSQ